MTAAPVLFHPLTDPVVPSAPQPERVGGKGAHLARLHALGLRVPPAVAIDTGACRFFMERGSLPEGFASALDGWLERLDEWARAAGRRSDALLVSVRSSPPISMPGMLRTIVNVGSTEATTAALVRESGRPWFAWDTYRRFILSFAEGVRGCPAQPFEALAQRHLASAGVDSVRDLDALALRRLVRESSALASALAGAPLPADRAAQTLAAVEAVMRSWNSPWADEYRRLNGIDAATGTAVVVQSMVFGNTGARSGSGVAFTRDPSSGARELYADFVFNAQGEDIVSGRMAVADGSRLPLVMPSVWRELQEAATRLEREFGDMQDVEFTVDDGRLYFLQTRSGKRSPWAAVRIAADLVREGLIDRDAALRRLAALDLECIARQVARPSSGQVPLARAVPACAGCVTGAAVFDAARARAMAGERPVILVRDDLDAADLPALAVAAGILTRAGGRTSHAAVVARQMEKVCLVACAALQIEPGGGACTLDGVRIVEGAAITLDGHAGLIYAGDVPTVTERPESDLSFLAGWRGDGGRGDSATDLRQPLAQAR